eukprot:5896125-Amphidinium_carterae.2
MKKLRGEVMERIEVLQYCIHLLCTLPIYLQQSMAVHGAASWGAKATMWIVAVVFKHWELA